MADTVRYHMEEMVPELDDLEKRGFFNRSELKQIAAKRADFEYLLKRRATLREDFLRYIDHEKQIESLRLMRKKSRKLHGKATLADYAGVRRIHFIFERATRKFAGDLRIWSLWLQFCQESGSAKRVSRVLTKALQLHPNAAGLWSHAAAWELQHNGNAAAARTLMQRGLRMCLDSPHLWVEYFRMELTYAHRLRTRRRILGLDDPGTASGAQTISGAARIDEAAEEDESDKAADAALQAVLSGGIAQVVYKSAIAAVPNDISFRRKFLKALEPFRFPGVDTLEDTIYSSIALAFPGVPEAVDIAARRGVSGTLQPQQLQAASQVYEEALRQRPNLQMFDLYVVFLTEQLHAWLEAEASQQRASADADGPAAAADGHAAAVASQLLQTYERAATTGCASEDVLLEWPALALRCGRHEAALSAARQAADAMPASVPLRRQHLAMKAQHLALQLATADSEQQRKYLVGQLEAAVLQAVSGADPHEGAWLWLTALEALMAAGAPLQKLLNQFVLSFLGQAQGPLRGNGGEAAAAAVDAVHATSGLAAARDLWRRLAKGPSPGGAFWVTAARLESGAIAEGHPDASLVAAQTAFEGGVTQHGQQDWELWLEYVRWARMAQSQGRSTADVDITKRAHRTLHDATKFNASLKQLHT